MLNTGTECFAHSQKSKKFVVTNFLFGKNKQQMSIKSFEGGKKLKKSGNRIGNTKYKTLL
jgi:hypothetical protein